MELHASYCYGIHRCVLHHGFCLLVIAVFVCIGAISGEMSDTFNMDESYCPPEDAKMFVKQVPWGVENRAYKTLPRGLVIAPSKIPNAGLGVHSETFIRRYTWFGEYDGEIIQMNDSSNISWYAWRVHRNNSPLVFLDGFHLHTSSYLRFFNTPLRYSDVNVLSLECYGKIHYVAARDIPPGQELLLFYGYLYLGRIGINMNDYFKVQKELLDRGLDLNNEEQISNIENAGFLLENTADIPLLILPYIIGEDYIDTDEETDAKLD